MFEPLWFCYSPVNPKITSTFFFYKLINKIKKGLKRSTVKNNLSNLRFIMGNMQVWNWKSHFKKRMRSQSEIFNQTNIRFFFHFATNHLYLAENLFVMLHFLLSRRRRRTPTELRLAWNQQESLKLITEGTDCIWASPLHIKPPGSSLQLQRCLMFSSYMEIRLLMNVCISRKTGCRIRKTDVEGWTDCSQAWIINKEMIES